MFQVCIPFQNMIINKDLGTEFIDEHFCRQTAQELQTAQKGKTKIEEFRYKLMLCVKQLPIHTDIFIHRRVEKTNYKHLSLPIYA
jgi:hypothetical protein